MNRFILGFTGKSPAFRSLSLAQYLPMIPGQHRQSIAKTSNGVLPDPLAVGNILLGIATLRGRVFPRFAGILLIVAAVVSLLGNGPLPLLTPLGDIANVVSNLALFLAFAGFGSVLVTQGKAPDVVVEQHALPVAQSGR